MFSWANQEGARRRGSTALSLFCALSELLTTRSRPPVSHSRTVQQPGLPAATPVPSPRALPRNQIRLRRREGQRGWVREKARPRGWLGVWRLPGGPGLQAPRGRAQKTPGARRRLGRLRPPRRPSESSPAARGRPLTGPWRRRRQSRLDRGEPANSEPQRGRPGLNSSPARLPRPRPRLSSAGQSQGRGGATRPRHWSAPAPVRPPEANGPAHP